MAGVEFSDFSSPDEVRRPEDHPGHDGWVVGDEPCVVVEFQGAAMYAKEQS